MPARQFLLVTGKFPEFSTFFTKFVCLHECIMLVFSADISRCFASRSRAKMIIFFRFFGKKKTLNPGFSPEI